MMFEDITENIRIVSIMLSAVLQLCYEGSLCVQVLGHVHCSSVEL